MPHHEAVVLETLAILDRPRSEKLYVTAERYRDIDYVQLRVWYRDEFGVMRPSRKGITLKPSELGTVMDALTEAIDQLDDGTQGF